VPKIISERCELVKLCHINRSGLVFLRQCIWSSINTGLNLNILCHHVLWTYVKGKEKGALSLEDFIVWVVLYHDLLMASLTSCPLHYRASAHTQL